jgi:hypothetical protein
MSEEAAQVDPNMPPTPEVEAEAAPQETPQAESAPVEQVDAPAEQDEAKEPNRVQERINKITADKYAEKRRADELERKLAEMQQAVPSQQQSSDAMPTLETFDYDEQKYQEALIDYKAEQKAKAIYQQQQQQQAQEQQAQRQAVFNAKVAEFTEKAQDYGEVVALVPELPPETLEAVMLSEKGPELAYYLGKHLDVADEIASASPVVAAMRLGEISVKLANEKPNIQPSAAPEPVETINSGGSASKALEDMSMDEIFAIR